MFQIVRISPILCPFTDGLIGNRAEVLPMTYAVEALAHKLAGRMTQADFDGFGDDIFRVIPSGGDVWRPVFPPMPEPDFNSIPF